MSLIFLMLTLTLRGVLKTLHRRFHKGFYKHYRGISRIVPAYPKYNLHH